MKKQLPAFLLGVLTAMLVGGLTVTSLAISGQMTITVDPINIQVNGETFQPKDTNGDDVAVFVYNGTTYAPLRALAEAYGLEVGYDAEKNLATVTDPNASTVTNPQPASQTPAFDWSEEEEAAYQEFKGLWMIRTIDRGNGHIILESNHSLSGYNTEHEVGEFLNSHTTETIEKICLRFDAELYEQYKLPSVFYNYEVNGSWGWEDIISDGGWKCGYR